MCVCVQAQSVKGREWGEHSSTSIAILYGFEAFKTNVLNAHAQHIALPFDLNIFHSKWKWTRIKSILVAACHKSKQKMPFSYWGDATLELYFYSRTNSERIYYYLCFGIRKEGNNLRWLITYRNVAWVPPNANVSILFLFQRKSFIFFIHGVNITFDYSFAKKINETETNMKMNFSLNLSSIKI